MRDCNIKKYEGNTHYSVNVIDSYGREKGNFFKTLDECYEFVYDVWSNEVPKTDKELQEDLLSSAISNCIEIDKQNNINLNLD
tara:strand:- start:319 stop:567 length:249 start_codon:yes stop_codon:yes gene_type:complete